MHDFVRRYIIGEQRDAAWQAALARYWIGRYLETGRATDCMLACRYQQLSADSAANARRVMGVE